MSTFKPVSVFCILCINVNICHSVIRTFEVEQIFYNKVVLDNILAEYRHSTSALCSVVCQQENCECFGFNSIYQMCRVHVFCRPDNTLVEESGWKYYRSKTKWNTFMNSEYLLGLEAVSWSTAQLDCIAKGSKLVEVESPEEDAFIRTLAINLTESVWLGGTDKDDEAKWVWHSTNLIFSYSAWYGGQPNNYQNQDCLSLYRPYGLTWCDESCEASNQYICKRETFRNT
ncbi:perlucin-like protein [Crassostrea angulata]|uniref:perlucin-like protein n=1 Tax=Magallana angulata TaxID=2784310 RepID=UPI0022B0DDEF|nr:perlucin-like protein [Crassostrea angulata]